MDQPENSPSTAVAETTGRPAHLQRFGRRAVVTALLGVLALWLHELFVDPATRQEWKLMVLLALIPLGVAGALALLAAWLGEWRNRRRV